MRIGSSSGCCETNPETKNNQPCDHKPEKPPWGDEVWTRLGVQPAEPGVQGELDSLRGVVREKVASVKALYAAKDFQAANVAAEEAVAAREALKAKVHESLL